METEKLVAKAVAGRWAEPQARLTKDALPTTVFLAILFCSACVLAPYTRTNMHRLKEVVQPPGSAHHSASAFAVVMTSIRRPGDAKYVSNAVMSLYCALNMSHAPSAWPTVLVINAQIPNAEHAVLTAMANDSRVQAYLRNGLSLEQQDTLHPQLHEPKFVMDLAARATMPEHHKGKPFIGDPVYRLWWRSKEVLDAAYALETGLSKEAGADYIIFMQDDVVFAGGFLKKLEGFVQDRAAANDTAEFITLWAVKGPSKPVKLPDPSHAHFGLVAIAIRRATAKELIPFLREHFTEKPVDLLVNEFIRTHNKSFWSYQPSLVQHVGLTSSLHQQQQTATSDSFSDRSCWMETEKPQ